MDLNSLKEKKGLISVGTKHPIDNAFTLGLMYTPGVGQACLEIKKTKDKINSLTNRLNSIGVVGISYNYEKALLKLPDLELKCAQIKHYTGFDAYPISLSTTKEKEVINILNNLTSCFAYYDLSITGLKIEKELNNPVFEAGLEPVKSQKTDIESLKNKDIKKASLELHQKLKGKIHTYNNFNIIDINQDKLIENWKNKILENQENSLEFCSKGNTVGVISEGSAVLGFGNIGSYASVPVMEGKCALLKEMAGVNAFPLCINTQKIDEFCDIVERLTPALGGINLEDIKAPNCFEIEEILIKTTNIPIFHDDQHGTAIIVLAAVLNCLKLQENDIKNTKIAVSGAGAAAQAVVKLLLSQGFEDIIMSDIEGIVHKNRQNMDKYLYNMALKTNTQNLKGSLKEAIKGADIFIGLSAGNIVDEDMVKSMNTKPAILALANPTPEIMPDIAKKAGAYIVATGRSDFKNQVNNSLAFPGVFRGVLDNKIKIIDDEIKIKASKAIVSLQEKKLNPEFILPDALDKKVPIKIADSIV